MKNLRKILILFVLHFVFFTALCFSQDLSDQMQILEAEEISGIDDRKTEILIKSNVKKANVFLNNQFFGTTSLEIKNLIQGTYILKIEKSGMEPQVFQIEAENGKRKTFYIPLKSAE